MIPINQLNDFPKNGTDLTRKLGRVNSPPRLCIVDIILNQRYKDSLTRTSVKWASHAHEAPAVQKY